MSEAEEKLIKILEEHITLHSVRQGYGVFNITSFEEIARGILEAGYLRVEPVQCPMCPHWFAVDGKYSCIGGRNEIIG